MATHFRQLTLRGLHSPNLGLERRYVGGWRCDGGSALFEPIGMAVKAATEAAATEVTKPEPAVLFYTSKPGLQPLA